MQVRKTVKKHIGKRASEIKQTKISDWDIK